MNMRNTIKDFIQNYFINMDKEIANKIIESIEREVAKYEHYLNSDDQWIKGYVTGLNTAKLEIYKTLNDERKKNCSSGN